LFFSLSGCKRPGYVLPALPLLALILGTFVTHGLPWRRWMRAASSLDGHRWARRLAAATFVMGSVISVAVGLSNMWNWPAAMIAAVLFAAGAFVVVSAPLRGPAWTSWVGCVAVVLFLLGLGQRVWLPDYHERFGLRRQVEISSEYEQEEELPIVTFPNRWDSI